MAKLLTSDGVEVDWPHPCGPTTSLTSETLAKLLDKDPVNRCMAMAEIPRVKAQHIYRGSSFYTFDIEKRIGRRIIEWDVADLARGLSAKKLQRLIGTKSRAEAIERLMLLHL